MGFFELKVRPMFPLLFLLTTVMSLGEGLRIEFAPAAAEGMIATLQTGVRRALARFFFIRADFYGHTDPRATKMYQSGTEVMRASTAEMSKEIIPALALAATLDPELTEASTLLAEYLSTRPEHRTEAIRLLQRAIQTSRDHPRLFRLYGTIGSLYRKQQQWAPASRYYQQAVALYPRMKDRELCRSFSVTPEEEDQFYGEAYNRFLVASYFNMRAFDRALLALESARGWNLLDSPMAQFLLRWKEDRSVADNFDPERYIKEASTEGGEPDHAHHHDEIFQKGMAGREVHLLLLEREFLLKLGILSFFPLLLGLLMRFSR